MGSINETLSRLAGSGVDNPAAMTSQHVASGFLAAEKNALGVDRHYLVPFCFGEVLNLGDGDHSGILNRDVDRAEAFDSGSEKSGLPARALKSRIANDRYRLGAGFFQFGRDFFHARFISGEHEVSAFLSEALGEAGADTAASAGDEDGLILEALKRNHKEKIR